MSFKQIKNPPSFRQSVLLLFSVSWKKKVNLKIPKSLHCTFRHGSGGLMIGACFKGTDHGVLEFSTENSALPVKRMSETKSSNHTMMQHKKTSWSF